MAASSSLQHLGWSSVGSQPAFDSKTLKKALEMQKKTEFCIQTFNLPSTEQVVQNYTCSAGQLWMTYNFFCYSSRWYSPAKISYRAVRDVRLVGKKIYIDYEVSKDETAQIYFSITFHPLEAFNVLQYLRYNSVAYVPLTDARSSAPLAGPDSGTGLGDLGHALAGREAPGLSFGLGSMTMSSSLPMVDLEASAEALRHLLAAREMGLATLEELRDQREMLDRIENTTANIHANLDKSQRVIRGITSFGGGLRNLLSRDKTRGNNPAFRYLERDIHLAELRPPVVELAIMLKNPNDSLVPCALRFKPDSFEVFNTAEQKVVKDHHWPYAGIDVVVLRARPLHIDVRFGETTPLFRMMTSYAQAVTNELFLRALNAGHEPEIVFEPNIPQFDFGSYRLSLIGTDTKYDPSNPFRAGGAQPVVRDRASDILGLDVTEETRQAYDRQDQDVDAIIAITGQLKIIGEGIGREVEDSTRHIERVGGAMAAATERSRQQHMSVDSVRS